MTRHAAPVPALAAEGYAIRDRRSSAPTPPGLRPVDAALGDNACVHFDLRM